MFLHWAYREMHGGLGLFCVLVVALTGVGESVKQAVYSHCRPKPGATGQAGHSPYGFPGIFSVQTSSTADDYIEVLHYWPLVTRGWLSLGTLDCGGLLLSTVYVKHQRDG